MAINREPYYQDMVGEKLELKERLSLAYYAGLFDGEGCVSINKVKGYRGRKDSFQLRVSVSSTHKQVLDRLQIKFGGVLVERKRSGAQVSWQWVMTSRMARDFLMLLEPYLIIKSEQAKIGILFQNERDARNGKLAEDSLEKEFQHYESIRRLNARWGTEYYEGA
ncbi:HNH endonuclease [Streptomyces phage Braelyn]|uniref:LAGLIDADG endonuclease n=1 Tax=Streptomyces phage Braelyn TaxID=2593356 RepID=A0A514U1R0_9CAUD|nr:HNH endonuclease [Streptomyces phage Braelyn]QDK02883.1 LAGLIDADG endonuclease [Streptomyces phage Braelyn]